MTQLRYAGVTIAIVLATLPSAVGAQQPRDPKVQAVLDQCIAATRGLAAVHIRIVPKVTNPDLFFTLGLPDSIELRFQKPNKLRAEIMETRGGKPFKRVIVTDGVNLWRWQTGATTTEKTAAPKTLAEITEVPPISPEVPILLNPAFDFKDWPAPSVNLTLGNPEKLGAEEVDVVQAGMNEPGAAGSANLRLIIGKKDHIIRGLTVQVNGKDPATNKELTGKFEAIHEVVEISPVFPPGTFTVGTTVSRPNRPAGAKPAPKP